MTARLLVAACITGFLILASCDSPTAGDDNLLNARIIGPDAVDLGCWMSQSVKFSSRGSTGPIEGYEWTVDGVEVSTERVLMHTLEQPGEYTIGLT